MDQALAQPSLRGRRRPWQDLPSELLGIVLQRVPSHAGRVRLRAVCRSWRVGARMQSPLPSLLPWLALRDRTFLSLSDGEVHRRIVAPDADVVHRVSTGGMLFLVDSNEGCSLMNPLSRERTARQRIHFECPRIRRDILLNVDNIRKVVVLSNHVTAVRTGYKIYMKNLTISVHRPRSSTMVWQWKPPSDTYSDYILDIALFQEKLFVLVTTGRTGKYPLRLYAMDIIEDKSVSMRCVISTPKDDLDRWDSRGFPHYLVPSGDRLLMVKQIRELDTEFPFRLVKQALFEVFEAEDMSSGRGQWRKIDTLVGRALFLSEGCSESLPIIVGGQCVGPQEDSIYFLNERNKYDERMRNLYSGIYNMKEETVSPLPFDKVAARDGPWTATWFFPGDT